MTRINCIHPSWLADQHLIAEYKELPRVFTLARLLRPQERGPYKMGTGHVRFFYERTGWLSRRQEALIEECLGRGFNIQYTTAPDPLPGLDGDWDPTTDDAQTNLIRLAEKVEQKPGWYKHRGVIVSDNFYSRHLRS